MTTEQTAATYDGNVLVPSRGHPWFPWYCPKPTVRILCYTDHPQVNFELAPDFGLRQLRDLIVSHNTFHANFDIDVLDRHAGGHAKNLLTTDLLRNYDQVWLFGFEQCDRSSAPHNELTDAEVAALDDWMGPAAQGGVLITGDHANPRPGDATDAGLDPLLNLGRALGHRVPRAGRLRRWEGLPSADPSTDPRFTHNTQVPDGLGTPLDNLTLQDDAFPQRIRLTPYPIGRPWPWLPVRHRPHPLFCGRSGPIEVFPDHMHEGALAFPASYPEDEWPSGPHGQLLPEVVAFGTDKRFARTYELVSAYDGTPASVGRIVADTTWHHYFNVNLRGFSAGPVRDAIADFYVNLAVWLSPPALRHRMRCWFWWTLATHPAVQMVKGHRIPVLGRTAVDVLDGHAGQCLLTELTWPFHVPVEHRAKVPWPPDDVVIGGVVKHYHDAFDRALGGDQDLPDINALVHNGVQLAVDEHVAQLREFAAAADELPRLLDGLRRSEAAIDSHVQVT
ncbi:hypothetical protein [Lentzea waywayandensis]|uniref:hypothetical protein n=1 Tax=Lentzea waywayandensis TaxID=84724 RepID=UPI0011602E19|nr:hypothetical protein [Lentzea waywayandensis]